MKRDDILSRLRERRREIAERFGVERVGLFGSAARDELREDSDVDVLVSFRGHATFDGYMGLKSLRKRVVPGWYVPDYPVPPAR